MLEELKKRIAVLSVVVCAVFLLAACAGGTSIVGKWKSDSDSMTVVEFASNGTLNTYYNGRVIYSAKYTTEGDKLIIGSDSEEQTGTFKIEGNKLTVVDPNNETEVFTRE